MSNNSSGGYTTSASSTNHANTFLIWKVHNKIVGDEGWHGNSSEYSSSTRYYTGSFSTTYDGSSTVSGEWIQLQFPSSTSIAEIEIAARTGSNNYLNRCAGDGIILGSTDGSTWSSIATFSNKTYTIGNYTDITFTESSNYTYFRLVITRLSGNSGQTTVNISEINYVSPGSLVDQWSQQDKIQASDPQADDTFGRVSSLSGDYLAVGAHQEDTGGSQAGSVYIFKYDATYPPDDLPNVDNAGTGNGFNFKRYTSLDTSTHYVYKMWRNSANDWRTPSPVSYTHLTLPTKA